MDGVATLSKFLQHGGHAIENLLRFIVVFTRKRITDLEHVLNRCAFKCRPTCNLKESPPISLRGLAVAFGNIQGDRLRSAQELILCAALITLEPGTKTMLPADVLDRRTVNIKFLMPSCIDQPITYLPEYTPSL